MSSINQVNKHEHTTKAELTACMLSHAEASAFVRPYHISAAAPSLLAAAQPLQASPVLNQKKVKEVSNKTIHIECSLFVVLFNILSIFKFHLPTAADSSYFLIGEVT